MFCSSLLNYKMCACVNYKCLNGVVQLCVQIWRCIYSHKLKPGHVDCFSGWCYEKGELLLIYQYMPNGSLDQHLFHHGQNVRPTLRWETRYRVVADVAAALHYVHYEYDHVVLHRDIKASNIMLDANFNGRLGDFGLAGLVDIGKNSLSDLAVAGTWGFIAPEYPMTHKATRRTDVYAFGVLILEIVTGKRSLGAADTEFQLLTDWVWWLHGEGRLLEALDDDLTAVSDVDADASTRLLDSVHLGSDIGTSTGGMFNAADAIRLLLLGLACTNPNPTDRPTTAELVQIIAKRIPPPDVPLDKPTFVWPLEGELSLSDDDLDQLDDDFVDMSRDEEPDRSTVSREGLALSIGHCRWKSWCPGLVDGFHETNITPENRKINYFCLRILDISFQLTKSLSLLPSVVLVPVHVFVLVISNSCLFLYRTMSA